jgi:hypothetical protein
MLLNTSLLRERFIIRQTNESQTIQAAGNRILLPLTSKNGEIRERFIIRAHSMHMALRMAAEISREFATLGPLLNRQSPFNWKDCWYDLTTDFERPHVPETWCAVYHNGRVVFSDGVYHPFLDVIEQCDVKNRSEYDRAITIAEDVFKKAGKEVVIDHDINIALVIGVMEQKTRCGLILRASDSTSTFNMQIEPDKDYGNRAITIPHALLLASYFLEGIQLAVTTGYLQKLMHEGKIATGTPKARKANAAYKRIGQLSQFIKGDENRYNIRYRPERPDFIDLLEAAKDIG